MICEKCGVSHDGKYASGRFCSPKCSRSYSASVEKEKANKKVSETLKRKHKLGLIKLTIISSSTQQKMEEWRNKNSFKRKLKNLLISQENKCKICKIDNYNGEPLVLELCHIDSDHKNNSLDNLIYLCPNCNSQTLNYRGRNTVRLDKLEDHKIIEAVKESKNHKELLKKLRCPLTNVNYERISEKLLNFSIDLPQM